jgi:cytoskeletal protein CcmA (bactofilin family)
MKEKENNRLSFSGSSTISNLSTEKKIRISGSCKIEGNLESNGFLSSGSVSGKGNLLIHGNIKNSGSFKLVGSIFCENMARFSGSTKIDGNLEVKRTMVNSGSLFISGKLNVIGQVKLSGSSEVGNGITILGTLINSGGLRTQAIKVKDNISSSGSLNVLNNIESEKLIDISGKMTCHQNIIGESILLSFNKREKKRLFVKFKHQVDGNIEAKDLVSVDRAKVHGDIRCRSALIGKDVDVQGVIYYVDDCIIDEKAILKNKPVKISEDNLLKK